jgi:hypothetical protein
MNFALCPTRVCASGYPPQPCFHVEVCCCSLCARLCGVLKRPSEVETTCLGKMLWPATHVHARAARVLPSRSTVFYSSVCGPRGVSVPSQTGGATFGVSRRAFLSGQDLVSARNSFVARPLRSSCRKLPGVLTVRLDAGVETRLFLRSFPSPGMGFTQRAHDRLGQAHGRCWRTIRGLGERGLGANGVKVHSTLGGSGEAGHRPVAGDAAPGERSWSGPNC